MVSKMEIIWHDFMSSDMHFFQKERKEKDLRSLLPVLASNLFFCLSFFFRSNAVFLYKPPNPLQAKRSHPTEPSLQLLYNWSRSNANTVQQGHRNVFYLGLDVQIYSWADLDSWAKPASQKKDPERAPWSHVSLQCIGCIYTLSDLRTKCIYLPHNCHPQPTYTYVQSPSQCFHYAYFTCEWENHSIHYYL